MSIKASTTYRNERRILRKIINALLAAGYVVRFTDADDEGPGEPVTDSREGLARISYERDGRTAWNYDEIHVLADKDGARRSFVWLIFGNGNDGLDVVTDYGMSLDAILTPILDAIEAAY